MSRQFTREFYTEVDKGNVAGHSMVHKFGRNAAVSTTPVPVSIGGIFRTPQVGSATTLRLKAGGDANDTAAGSGAREVTLIGVNAAGAEVSEAVATAGASASSATTEAFIRLTRAYVSASGTYATESAGSHAAGITVEDSGGTQDWATISVDDFPRGQTEIGIYTIPTGFTGYLTHVTAFTDGTKTTKLILFRRESILDTSPPYEAMRMLRSDELSGGTVDKHYDGGLKIIGPADVGFMAEVDAGSAQVVVDFDLLLLED